MRTVHGWVHGVYDSRGGTVFYLGTEDEAKQMLLESWMNMEEVEEHLKYADLWRRAKLHLPESFDKRQVDLEWGEEGAVICAGSHTEAICWDTDHDDCVHEVNDEKIADTVFGVHGGINEGRSFTQELELEFVPQGQQPQIFTSWGHVRWDDDACSFCLY